MRIYGRNPVLERLKENPKSISHIFIQEGHPDSTYIRQKAGKWGIAISIVPGTKIQKLARDTNTQGLIIEVEDFGYLDYPELLEWCTKKKASLLFLDGLNDPQNFGSIIRALACLGDFGVVIPTHKSVQVTETVLRIACGGDNFVKVSRVANINQAVRRAKEEGFWIAGTVVKDGTPLTEIKFPHPLGLVIGSEHKGVRDVVLSQLDMRITIPMAKPRLSLNVGQATAIFAYEIMRQQAEASK